MIDWEQRAALVVKQIEQLAASLDAADEAAAKLGWSDANAAIAKAKGAVKARFAEEAQ